MKSLWISFALIAAFTVAVNLPISAQSAEQLYQKGLMKEEGEGALQDAIDLYSQIADNTGADQSLRAKALLHIGMCYEKMGTQEAVRAYQRLVNAFPTQTNEVAIARERLNRLLLTAENTPQKNPVPKFTRIKIPSEPWYSTRLSPDGEKIAIVSDKKLWIMPLSGNAGPDIPGQPVQLNTNGIQPEWTSGLSWSGDGKWIAFNELPDQNRPVDVRGNQSIYVVPVTGGHPKKVIENFRSFTNRNYTISLSTDGKTLAHTAVVDNKQFIYTTQVNGNSQKKLAGIQAREPAFSPDGKWIAFVEDKILGNDGGKLCIVPSAGGDPVTLVELNQASSPVWSPDGKMIAFIDEEENKKIQFVQVGQNGETDGNVTSVPIPEEMEKVDLLTGWGTNNKLSVLLSTDQEYSMYTLPAKGGQVSMLLNDRLALQPRWSAARDEIIFITTEQDQPFIPPALVFATMPSKGGSEKILKMEYNNEKVIPGPPELGRGISPDGRSLVFTGWTMSDTTHDLREQATSIWSYSFDDQSTKRLTNEKRLFVDRHPSWSPDGKRIAFMRYHVPEGSVFNWDTIKIRIYTMNSSGGDLKLLYSDNDFNPSTPVWSPDGKMISYLTRLENEDKYRLNVINVQDGKTRIVCEIPEFFSTMDPCWSPDSKKIAWNDGKVIKVVHLDDGILEEIQTNLKDDVNVIYYLDWSPDGEQFVFGGANLGESELWLVEDFLPLDKLPDQSGPALTEEPEGIRIRNVWETPYMDYLGTVSYDGKFRACVYWGLGDVAIHNLETDEIQQLTHDANLGENFHFAESPTFSKDGKRIAYSWCNPYNTNGLWIINVDDRSKELLYKKEGEELYPAAWLSDNELVVTRYFPDSRRNQILICNVQDKTFRVKKDFDKINSFQGIACSPDEKYIAYGYTNEADNGNLDIRLLVADGNEDIPLISHPSNDKVIGWVPGKNVFLFISDRSGTWDLWGVPINGWHTTGPAKLIYTDLGDVSPVGFTSDGTCYYGFTRRNFYSSISPFNNETGKIELGSGETMSGSNFGITWSPDGQHLAYIKIGERIGMAVRDLQTGKELDLTDLKTLPAAYCWSSDSKSILVVGGEEGKRGTDGYKGELVQVDLESGRTEEVFQLSDYEFNLPEDDRFPLSSLEHGVDGESFYYLFFRDRLVKHDLKTDTDKILYRNSYFAPDVLSLSPDGKNLLFGIFNLDEQKCRLLLIPAEGGREKEICTIEEYGNITNAFWSPDGKYIYFVGINQNMQTDLLRVLSEGGDPEKVWSYENRVDIFAINTDGNRIALSVRDRKTEVRAIENLYNEIDALFTE